MFCSEVDYYTKYMEIFDIVSMASSAYIGNQLCKFKFFQVLTIQLIFILAILSPSHIEFKNCTLF